MPEVYTGDCMVSQRNGWVSAWRTQKPAARAQAGDGTPGSAALEHPMLENPAPLVRRAADCVVAKSDPVTVDGVGEDPTLDGPHVLPVRIGDCSRVLERLRRVVPAVRIILLVEREADSGKTKTRSTSAGTSPIELGRVGSVALSCQVRK